MMETVNKLLSYYNVLSSESLDNLISYHGPFMEFCTIIVFVEVTSCSGLNAENQIS